MFSKKREDSFERPVAFSNYSLNLKTSFCSSKKF
jgi:hypothetical protein